MQRREFIKGSCRICLLGGLSSAFIEACSPSVAKNFQRPVIKNKQVEILLSVFDAGAFQIVSPQNYPFEISVEKINDQTYRAMLLKCTHYENQLTATGNGFICAAHGSKFTREGKVLNGPAAAHLLELKTQLVKQSLLIHL